MRYNLTSLQLAPHETRAIDLRQLRDAQVADFKNNKIPTSAVDGSVSWVRVDNVPVAGRLVVISRSGGIASNYDCQTCNCPITLYVVAVAPGSCDMIPGDTMQCASTATYVNCNAYPYYYDETSWSSWSSNNTSVSTVNSTGLETIQGGGTSTITASFTGATSYTYNCYRGCTCIEHDSARSGTHGTTGQKPAILKVISTTSSPYCSGTSCMVSLRYQVLDGSGAPIAISGMLIKETVTGTHTGNCTGSLADLSTWTTDSTGSMPTNSPDSWWWCCSTGCGGSYNFTQTFTVDGFSVTILNGSITGSHNAVTVQCNNGQGTCPVVVPTP